MLLDTATETGGRMVISAIGGSGGIGKTWLALHWAHQNADRFPDGQLYVDLRGFDPTGALMHPAVAVRGFLDALGVQPNVIPVEMDAQAALYRSLVAGRRMLIVLDNARDSAQVAPLLPGSSTCMVLVTSRRRLPGLVTAHGALPLDLDVLPEAEARELLGRRIGHSRIAAEPAAVGEILALCAGLPLAISIVAACATNHPDFPLAVLAGELRDASARLDALDAGELTADLRAVFSWSFHALGAETAVMFGLLGLMPGPDIGGSAAACLTALPITRARALLKELEHAHLLRQHAPGRYRMHDLIRLYAAEHAGRDHSAGTRTVALRRLVDFYLHTANTGHWLLDPHRQPIKLDHPPVSGCLPQPLQDEAAALTWFDTEYPCLLAIHQLAIERGWHLLVWQLAWELDGFHRRRGHVHANLATWRAGLAAADRLGDPAIQARAHLRLGNACNRIGRHTEGLNHLRQALTLSEQSGSVAVQGHIHHCLAWAWELQGDDQQALTHATRALRLSKTLDNPVWEARALNAVGRYQARLGQHQQAYAYCEQALSLFREYHDRDGEADTLNSLGYIAHRSGQHDLALGYYHRALTLFRALGGTYDEANTLDRLGRSTPPWSSTPRPATPCGRPRSSTRSNFAPPMLNASINISMPSTATRIRYRGRKSPRAADNTHARFQTRNNPARAGILCLRLRR